MALIGSIADSIDDVDADWYPVCDMHGTETGAKIRLRIMPSAQAKREVLKTLAKYKHKTDSEQGVGLEKLQIDTLCKCLVDTEGWECEIKGDASVAAYQEFIPNIKAGRVSLDGLWTEGLKRRYFTDDPFGLGIAWKSYEKARDERFLRLSEDEEKKDETSSAGSGSGSE